MITTLEKADSTLCYKTYRRNTNKTHSSEAKVKMKDIRTKRKLFKQISSESALETSLSALEFVESQPDQESLF